MDDEEQVHANPLGLTPALGDDPPVPPREPDPDECCGSGCVHCVFDRYQNELARYRRQLAAWQQARASKPPAS